MQNYAKFSTFAQIFIISPLPHPLPPMAGNTAHSRSNGAARGALAAPWRLLPPLAEKSRNLLNFAKSAEFHVFCTLARPGPVPAAGQQRKMREVTPPRFAPPGVRCGAPPSPRARPRPRPRRICPVGGFHPPTPIYPMRSQDTQQWSTLHISTIALVHLIPNPLSPQWN